MVVFAELSAEAARTHLRRFIDELPASFRQLIDLARAGDGPDAAVFDYSEESLDPIWKWALSRVRRRQGEPLASGGAWPGTDLPSWVEDRVPFWGQFDDRTLWVVDSVGRYLGETLVRTVPGAHWAVGQAPRRNYVYRNHPVVVAPHRPNSMEPLHAVGNLVYRYLDGDEGPDLMTIAQNWRGSPP